MYGELRSPNVHEPKNMTEYTNTVINYRDSIANLWSGGTYIMNQKDFYPSNSPNIELISLGAMEELKHFQRNDRYAEFGAMVNLNDVATAGKLVLPKILLDAIKSTACRLVRDQITIGGALCTPTFRTSIASTLMILDSTVELRYMGKNRMHSKWFHISRLYDKNGQLAMPKGALLTKVRIGIQQHDFHLFQSVGSPFLTPTESVTLAAIGKLEQNSISNARLIITLPQLGFCCYRDIDNTLSSLQIPIDQNRFSSFESYIFSYIKDNIGVISHLQEARLKGMLQELMVQLNQQILSL